MSVERAEEALRWAEQEPTPEGRMFWVGIAQTHAVLAQVEATARLADEQRMANLIATLHARRLSSGNFLVRETLRDRAEAKVHGWVQGEAGG